MFRADAKAQVSFDYDSSRITTFLCSVQHSPDVEVSDFRHIIESMMVLAACEYGLNGDFQKLVNPTGRFVIGGSFADCGVTGRKLACDTCKRSSKTDFVPLSRKRRKCCKYAVFYAMTRDKKRVIIMTKGQSKNIIKER